MKDRENLSNTQQARVSRRDFFEQIATRAGGASLAAALLATVEQAAAIEADPGSTFLDAEHIVVLMQENRSFDHVYGTLNGVRGFADPRTVTLPDGKPVWLQSNAAGETYSPFHLDIDGTNITWLGSLPHSWRDQTDACASGNHDQWLESKASGRKECKGMPFTLGYFDRTDLPFYYALADAFTLCDQNFCSSLTGTTPNRLYLWTGTIREKHSAATFANVRNSDVTYGQLAKWTTFPERLEDAGIPWKIYQNELSLPTGLTDDGDAWLANFTDNPIEWFEQYGVFYSKTFQAYARKAVTTLPAEISELEGKVGTDPRLRRTLDGKQRELKMLREALVKFSPEAWQRWPERNKSIHSKAFTTNTGDPDYRSLATLKYRDGNVEREMAMPKGDVLHQFRKDVETGTLPAVSWIVPPERFSDHPGSPWYGAWMLSEVMRILTEKPEVWKKTIFILTYDENDGYFDHVPPFRAPDVRAAESGKTTDGIDASEEYWPLERDLEKRTKQEGRGGSIGLGFRVPLLVASPWSRGGKVCSQVFDHTSVLQLMEVWLTKKTGKPIRETNISTWRRAVCGDLTAAFEPAGKGTTKKLTHPTQASVLEGIHKAQFQKLPSGFHKVDAPTAGDLRRQTWFPKQESGPRRSLALPYELRANGGVSADGKSVEITLEAGNRVFGKRSAGAPYHVYAPGGFRKDLKLRTRTYAVEAGKKLTDTWALEGFPDGRYHLSIHGPNGFWREIKGSAKDPKVKVAWDLEMNGRPTGNLVARVRNEDLTTLLIEIRDAAYGNGNVSLVVPAGEERSVVLNLAASHRWYDYALTIAGIEGYERRFAGRVETGQAGLSDPQLDLNHAPLES